MNCNFYGIEPDTLDHWSLRRERIFRRCPRELYLDSRGGRGGHEPMAPEPLREIHFAKQLCRIPAFCRKLTAEEWLACFREHGDFSRIPGRIFRRWALLRKSILLGENRIDHRLPILMELEEPGADLEEVLDQIHGELKRLTTLPAMQALQKLLEPIPYPHRLTGLAPLSVHLGELTLFTGTLLGFQRNGKLCFLTFCAAPDPELLEISGVIERYFALHCLKIPPEKVSSMVLDCISGEFFVPPRDFYRAGETLQRIAESAAEIREALHNGTAANSPRQEHCGKCRFRTICRKDHEL